MIRGSGSSTSRLSLSVFEVEDAVEGVWVFKFSKVRTLLFQRRRLRAGIIFFKLDEPVWVPEPRDRFPELGLCRIFCFHSSQSKAGPRTRQAFRRLKAWRAGRILAEELGRLGWSESDLTTRRKSDPAKLAIGTRLKKQMTLTIKSIAAKVHLGTSKSANFRLHAWMRGNLTAPPQPVLCL